MKRGWTRRIALAGAVAGAGLAAAAVTALPASADAPVQVGWWNAASGGGSAAPDPATPPGGIHVSAAPGQILAFGAVLYSVSSGDSFTLTLQIAQTAGTGSVEACPTKTTNWKAGDDQPASDAPAYDCTTHYVGLTSSDGKSVTFLVDQNAMASTPGQLSLAILPVQTDQLPVAGTDTGYDTTQPYSLDIAKPDTSSLVISGGGSTQLPAGAPTPAGPPANPAPAPGGSSAGSSLPASGSVAMPVSGSTGTAPSSTDTGAAPVVAPQTPASTNAIAPAAAKTSTNTTAHDAAIALLVLLAILVVGGGNATMRPSRHLGAHRGVPAQTPQTPAMAMAALPMFAPRGLGRFAKPRSAPPRPLT